MNSNNHKIALLLCTALWFSGSSCNRQQRAFENMAANEALITKTFNIYMDSCWNKGETKGMKDIATANFTRNFNGIKVAASQNEMQAHMVVYFKAFPDLQVTMDSTYFNDNTIFTHWTSTGTHTGVFGEMAATGKKVKISGLSQLFFNTEGKLIQEDVVFNELQVLQQLGYTLTPPVLE